MRIRQPAMLLSAGVYALLATWWFVRGDVLAGGVWCLATLLSTARATRPPTQRPDAGPLRATGMGMKRFFSGWPPYKDPRGYR
jgi:hypothetical protein